MKLINYRFVKRRIRGDKNVSKPPMPGAGQGRQEL
jgi:hypothetical protein